MSCLTLDSSFQNQPLTHPGGGTLNPVLSLIPLLSGS